MNQMVKAVMSCLFFAGMCSSVLAADVQSGYLQSKVRYEAAMASLASYDDKPGRLARQEYREEGWQIENLTGISKSSQAEFILSKNIRPATSWLFRERWIKKILRAT